MRPARLSSLCRERDVGPKTVYSTDEAGNTLLASRSGGNVIRCMTSTKTAITIPRSANAASSRTAPLPAPIDAANAARGSSSRRACEMPNGSRGSEPSAQRSSRMSPASGRQSVTFSTIPPSTTPATSSMARRSSARPTRRAPSSAGCSIAGKTATRNQTCPRGERRLTKGRADTLSCRPETHCREEVHSSRSLPSPSRSSCPVR